MTSVGYKKDLLVMMFASSIVAVTDHEETKTDNTIVKNTDYKLNKRIDRRLHKLKADIDSFIHREIDKDTARWIKHHSKDRTYKALSLIDTCSVSLELMAVYVLYANFGDSRTLKLDESLTWVKDFNYMTIADLLMETEASVTEEDMYAVSYEIVNALKR